MKKYVFVLLALCFAGNLLAQKTNQRKTNQRKAAYIKFDGIDGERHTKPKNGKTTIQKNKPTVRRKRG